MIRSLKELWPERKLDEPGKIAVAAAADQDVMDIIKASMPMGLARYILIDDAGKLRSLLQKNDISESDVELVDQSDHGAAAAKMMELARRGLCGAVMKGNLHTAIFFRALLDKENSGGKKQYLSQISVYDNIEGDGLQLLTDCAMAIFPTLEEKVLIIENAVELARRLGCEKPRVAVLSALEIVNPKIPDTMDAAVLSKMADRGQIKHCVIDGPFALDNALSEEAARHKGLTSPVAGHADILLAPNLQVGNVLHKALCHIAKKDVAAAIMGADIPVIATSRTDSVQSKLFTIALALRLDKGLTH